MISRRAWITAAVAALATGAGLSLWRHREPDPAAAGAARGPGGTGAGQPPDRSRSGPQIGPQADAAVNQLFAMELTGPAGEPMPMSQFRNKRLVVNFWATWCPPCVEEMPELSEMASEMAAQDVTFVGIAIDQPPNVARFLQKVPVSYPIVIAGSAGLGMVTALGNAQGGLPFTLVLDTDGQIRKRYLGKVEMADLRQVLTS